MVRAFLPPSSNHLSSRWTGFDIVFLASVQDAWAENPIVLSILIIGVTLYHLNSGGKGTRHLPSSFWGLSCCPGSSFLKSPFGVFNWTVVSFSISSTSIVACLVEDDRELRPCYSPVHWSLGYDRITKYSNRSLISLCIFYELGIDSCRSRDRYRWSLGRKPSNEVY